MRTRLTALALAALLLTAGCNKLTKENYDKLKIGMAYPEVVQLLGKPDHCSDTLGANGCTWGDEKTNIKVIFLANKVMVFSSEGLK